MFATGPSLAFWSLFAIELIGVISALATRMSEGCCGEACCHWLFFLALAAVGGATILSLGMGPSFWLAGGATLSLMILIAVCDFSRSETHIDGLTSVSAGGR